MTDTAEQRHFQYLLNRILSHKNCEAKLQRGVRFALRNAKKIKHPSNAAILRAKQIWKCLESNQLFI